MGYPALPLTDLYAPIGNDLEVVQHIFEEELTSELDVVNDLSARVRFYRGKMLRPALLLLSGQASGRLGRAHHTLGAVVEMVHMATLVHDDVLDEADERRRQPSVCAANGNVAAVLLGDYLISHAFHLCSSLNSQFASRRIGETTNTVCEGELLQNDHRGDDRLSESTYMDIIRRKTGALTATSCELGGRLAGADPAVVQALRAFGMSVGVAFQIVDDVLDLIGDRREVGKTLGRDISLGKLTLPTIHCLATAGPSTASALRAALRGQSVVTPACIGRWLDETDSVDYALSTATGYVHEALTRLDRLAPTEARAALGATAEFIVRRRS